MRAVVVFAWLAIATPVSAQVSTVAELDVPREHRPSVRGLQRHVRAMLRYRCLPRWQEYTRDSVHVESWRNARCERSARVLAMDDAAPYAIVAELALAAGTEHTPSDDLLDALWALSFPQLTEGRVWEGHTLDAISTARLLLHLGAHAPDLHERCLRGLDVVLEVPPRPLALDADPIVPRPRVRTLEWYRAFLDLHRTPTSLARAVRAEWRAARASEDEGMRVAIAVSAPRDHVRYLRRLLCDPTTPDHVRAYVGSRDIEPGFTNVIDLIDPCAVPLGGSERGVACPGAPARTCE